MITIRPAHERGIANLGWLNSHHSFSFGNYYDSKYMGFATLKVINEDKVAAGKGFSTHGHRDMEIISYVLEGTLEHKDNIGNGSLIRPGDVQRMSAGTGILHSEFNPSSTDPTHFLQIWIVPNQQGLEPSYEQKQFPDAEKQSKLKLVGSLDGREGSVTIHQDVDFYASSLQNGEEVHHNLQLGRSAWIQVVRGEILLNQTVLKAGDGAAVSQEERLTFKGQSDQAEILVFDMNQ